MSLLTRTKDPRTEVAEIEDLIARLDSEIEVIQNNVNAARAAYLDRAIDARIAGEPEPPVTTDELRQLSELRQRAKARLRIAEVPLHKEAHGKLMPTLATVEGQYAKAGSRVLDAIRELLKANQAMQEARATYQNTHAEVRHLALLAGEPAPVSALPTYPIGDREGFSKYLLKTSTEPSPVFQILDDQEQRWTRTAKDRGHK